MTRRRRPIRRRADTASAQPDPSRRRACPWRWALAILAGLVVAVSLLLWAFGRNPLAAGAGKSSGRDPVPVTAASVPGEVEGEVREAPLTSSPTATVLEGLPETNSVESLKSFELALVEGLVKAHPTDPRVLGLAGSVYNSQGDHARAVAYWEALLELNPREVRAYDAIAQIALLREEHSRALDLWRQAAALDPNLPEVHYHIGQALMLMGDAEGAIVEFELDIAAAPRTSQGYSLAGQLCRQLGRLEQAKGFFEREIAIRPDSTKAYYGLSTVCAQLGEEDASRRYLTTFKELKVVDARADQDARSSYDDLETLRIRVARTCTAVGEFHLARGDAAAAAVLWRQAGAIEPNDIVSRVALATVYQRQGRIDEALPYCEKLVQIEPGNPLRYLNLGVLYAQLGRHGMAGKAFERVCELAPQRPEGYRLLAQMRLETDPGSTETLSLARRAVALEASVPNYLVLSQAYVASGDWVGARDALERVLAVDPQNPKARAMYEQVRNQN